MRNLLVSSIALAGVAVALAADHPDGYTQVYGPYSDDGSAWQDDTSPTATRTEFEEE